MLKAKRKVKSVKDELIKKSREAILTAVQIYNNPQITFKSESFISLAVIAWTYLLHAYYRDKKIDYRYYRKNGQRKKYDKTKHGAYKHWELERCLNDQQCPVDDDAIRNLKFLIGLRHEVEHQMTSCIDEFLSAKLQACCINYNAYIKQFFGDKYGVDNELALSIQFSPITPEQQGLLIDNYTLSDNVKNYIVSYEKDLTPEQITNSRYAYRIVFVPINVNKMGQADRVVEFVKPDSPLAEGLNKEYALIKETEKPKYIPSQVVKKMKEWGFKKFNMHHHTSLWKSLNIDFSKTPYGTYVGNRTWMWYEKWIDEVKKHCEENSEKYR